MARVWDFNDSSGGMDCTMADCYPLAQEDLGMERRLAAILAADMYGYSRLMEADEDGVIARQKSHQGTH